MRNITTMQYNVYLYQNNYKQKTLYCTMIQKIYDSTIDDAHGHGHGCTSVHIVQKHTKNTVSYIPAFWHKSGHFCIGGVFSFFQASKEQTSRRVPLSHTQPMLTSAIAHHYRTTHTPPNPHTPLPHSKPNKPYT